MMDAVLSEALDRMIERVERDESPLGWAPVRVSEVDLDFTPPPQTAVEYVRQAKEAARRGAS